MTVTAEDADVVEQLARGEREALRQIYEKHKDDLLRLAGCMLANWTDAEDCLHDVFVLLANRNARERHVGNLKNHLMTAIANRSRDRLRLRKHE